MSDASIETGPRACNCGALRRAGRAVTLLYDRYLAGSGLTTGQYSILAELRRHGDTPPTLGALAQALVMDRAALTHTLKPLERDGLITVVPDPSDRRARRVQVTAEGERRFEAARGAWSQAQARFVQSFGTDQAIALRALLRLVEDADFGESH